MENKNLLPFLGLIVVFAACGNPGVTPDKGKTALVLTDSLHRVISVDTVRNRYLNDELLLNGRVTFDEKQVAHVYPVFGGIVTEVYAEVGDYVKKGDVLAVIKSSEIADFEKQRKDAKQRLTLSDRNLEAVRDMYQSGMASERDVLQAEQESVQAKTERQRLEEIYAIHHIQDHSAYSVVAPISGFVICKDFNKNMHIRSDRSEEMLTISGLSDIWVMADVYESDIRKVREKADVRITTLAYGDDNVFTGTIDKIYNLLDDESKTMKVRIKLKNEAYALKPGMFTNVYVRCTPEEKVLPCIPAGALVFDGGKKYVVCLQDDGILNIREVSLGKQTTEYCYLDAGIEDGERIVNTNALLIYNALK